MRPLCQGSVGRLRRSAPDPKDCAQSTSLGRRLLCPETEPPMDIAKAEILVPSYRSMPRQGLPGHGVRRVQREERVTVTNVSTDVSVPHLLIASVVGNDVRTPL